MNEQPPKRGRKCPKCGEPGGYQPEHSCPFQSDVNSDPDIKCNCCSYCEGQCADDI